MEINDQPDINQTDSKSEESFEIIQTEHNEDHIDIDEEKGQDEEKEEPHNEQFEHPVYQEDVKDHLLAGREKKNTSLCLSPRTNGISVDEGSDKALPKDLLSPETNECFIISEGEWQNHSSSSVSVKMYLIFRLFVKEGMSTAYFKLFFNGQFFIFKLFIYILSGDFSLI